jgi:hypothetical protein
MAKLQKAVTNKVRIDMFLTTSSLLMTKFLGADFGNLKASHLKRVMATAVRIQPSSVARIAAGVRGKPRTSRPSAAVALHRKAIAL